MEFETATDNEAVTEKGSFEDDDLVRKIRKNLRQSRNHLTQWRNDARESYDFFAGNQWDEKDLSKLREENRPAIVFNRIPRVINAVAGLELQNRQEVAYLPRENGDVAKSDILTGAADWVRDNCDAEDEESQMFKDCLMTGLGFTETFLDYEADPDGSILVSRINPLDVDYDPDSEKRNLDDAKWIARTKYYPRAEFEEIWPEAKDEIDVSFSEDPKGMQPHDATLAPWYVNDQSDDQDRNRENMVEVVQYQYWKRVVFYRVESAGEVQEYSSKEFRANRQEILLTAERYVKQTRKVFCQVFLAGDFILEKGESPVNAFTIRAVTGLVNHTKGTWFGLIHLMKDPQMWANKWLSQSLHIVNKGAKGGYFAEADAFEDVREAERTISGSDITYLNEDGLNKIKDKTPPVFPAQIDKLLQYAVGSISDLVGVNLEMLGMANREQSGVVEQQRKQAGITVVSDFFDALRRYRKEQGRVLADFIIEYISDGRLVKIVGKGMGEYVQMFKEDLSFKYDIIVDDSPTSPNQREAVFERLVTLFPFLLQAGIPIPPEILDYAPLPAQLSANWKDLIEAQAQPNPAEEERDQLRMQLAQLEAELKQVNIAKAQVDIEKTQADTTEKHTQSALNIARAEHEAALADMEAGDNAQVQLRENVKTTLDVLKTI